MNTFLMFEQNCQWEWNAAMAAVAIAVGGHQTDSVVHVQNRARLRSGCDLWNTSRKTVAKLWDE